MQYRKLGSSNFAVSTVSLGCWPIGGEFYGQVDDAESVRTIHAAGDAGVNFIDTAIVYGSGRSEKVVGQALAGHRRDQWVVASKCGRRALPDGTKLSKATRDWLMRDVDQSLLNLGLDSIDLYQLHMPDPETPLSESMAALVDMKKAGKIRAIGVSNMSVAQLEECLRHAPVASLQPPYSMFQRQIEADLLPFCQMNNVATMVYCPLARGLLTGKFTGQEAITDGARKDWKFFKGDNFAKSVAIVDRLKPIAAELGLTMTQLAVAWTIAQPGVTVAICGAKHPAQITESAVGGDKTLPAGIIAKINAVIADVASIV